MSEKRRMHSPEFKAEAVRMVVEQKNRRTEVARNLGISVSLLDTWIKKSRETVAPNQKPIRNDSDRIRQLERELEQARMERDILKKAVVFFAKEKP